MASLTMNMSSLSSCSLLADAEMTGPILEGMKHPVQLVARQDGVRHIVNMAAICVADSMRKDSYWETLANSSSDS